MSKWPERECSEEVVVFATEEFVKEMQDALDRVKRELSYITNVSDLLNWLKAQNPKPPTPVAKPDSDEDLDDDDDYDETLDYDYDETLDDDYDNEYDEDDDYDDLVDDDVILDDDDDAEVAKKLDAEVAKKVDAEMAEELDDMELDDDEDGYVAKKLGFSKEYVQLMKRYNVVWRKKDELWEEIKIIHQLAAFFLGPVVHEPQRYCIWFDYLEVITSIIIDYGNRAGKAWGSYYMKLYGCVMPKHLMPLPLPDIGFMAWVKLYKLMFQQHHSLQVLNRGPDGQQVQELLPLPDIGIMAVVEQNKLKFQQHHVLQVPDIST